MPKDRESLKLFFEKNLNQQFILTIDEKNQLPIELIEITAGKQMDEVKITSFSLLFRSDHTKHELPQKLYTISKGEEFNEVLFIIPKRPDEKHSFFEVIYN